MHKVINRKAVALPLWTILLSLLLSATAVAEEESAPAASEQNRSGESSAATEPAKRPAEKTFTPSEEIRAESTVSFPADI